MSCEMKIRSRVRRLAQVDAQEADAVIISSIITSPSLKEKKVITLFFYYTFYIHHSLIMSPSNTHESTKNNIDMLSFSYKQGEQENNDSDTWT